MPISDSLKFLESLPESSNHKEHILGYLKEKSLDAAQGEDGALLPSEAEVTDWSGLSRSHVGNLLRRLCREGVVRRVQVAGCYRYHVTRSWMGSN